MGALLWCLAVEAVTQMSQMSWGKNGDPTVYSCGHTNKQCGLEAYSVYGRCGTIKLQDQKLV